jgi:cyclic lactone autoinducer peptide
MKKAAKILSKTTRVMANVFVQASSPLAHMPKIPESLKKAK